MGEEVVADPEPRHRGEVAVHDPPRHVLGETGGELATLDIGSLAPEEFRAAIDELLGG